MVLPSLLSEVAFSQPVSDELGCFRPVLCLPSLWALLAVRKIIWEKEKFRLYNTKYV